MVAIRHTACNEQQRTTMILLCEDGSLRIYMANVENTSYWLQPSLQPSSVISIMKPVRKRKAAAISKGLLQYLMQASSGKYKHEDWSTLCRYLRHSLLTVAVYLWPKYWSGWSLSIDLCNSSYLASMGVSKGAELLQAVLPSICLLTVFHVKNTNLLSFSNSHIQPSELSYWLLWTQPTTHRCGVWRQWSAASLQCSADKAPAQFHWHVCGQHKGKWGTLGIPLGF